MASDAFALVATALAEASPGGVPGPQVPALLRAASALAGRAASSSLSPGRASESAAFPGSSLSPSARPFSCLLEATAAADVSADSAAVGAECSLGERSCLLVATATTAAISGDPSSDGGSVNIGAGESAAPCPTGSSSAAGASPAAGNVAGCTAEGESPPAPSHPVPQPPPPPPNQLPLPQPQLHHQPASQLPPLPSAPPAPPVAVPVAALPPPVEQRVMHVGTCLTLLSYVLDQLHVCLARQSVEVGGMLPVERSAAVAAATEMLHYLPLIGFLPGAPGAALGPGPRAMVRLAESAWEAPIGLVSAAASVLRWMDGRLCWILAE
ncbi:unnamed protein product [Closterium sp. Yama58-4]|nr:unnamed protein product [Closterium sp. Yama58-4]